MNALASPPPFPTNPAVGDTYCGWTWNGSQWICTQGQQVVIQTFLTSGTYQPSPGCVSLVVETIGAGGGGGGSWEAAAGQINAGAGGGSGGRSRKALPLAMVRGGVIVTIGSGGAGGQPGAANGGDGGATQFGALCVANGGAGGGTQSASVFAPVPGRGALPGVGDVAFAGNSGQPGYWQVWATPTNITAPMPMGGSIAGGVQSEVVAPTTAVNGVPGYANTGAGGGGAVQNQDPGGGAAGGTGGSGICWVMEYCFSFSGGPGGCDPCGGGMARVAAPQGWSGGIDYGD